MTLYEYKFWIHAEPEISYYPALVPVCGTITAAILFDRLVTILTTGDYHSDDWFSWQDKDLQEELAFTRQQLQNAKRILHKRGLISYKMEGSPYSMQYQ